MLTGLATTLVADAAGLAAGGGAEGPHAVATPTAASACRNRLRLIVVSASGDIFIPLRADLALDYTCGVILGRRVLDRALLVH
jgi:hypothetical protein